MLPVVMARSFLLRWQRIRYVLLVSWMTSYFLRIESKWARIRDDTYSWSSKYNILIFNVIFSPKVTVLELYSSISVFELHTFLSRNAHRFTLPTVVRWAKCCDQCVCVCLSVYLFVCLSFRLHISKTICTNFTKFCVHVTCGRSSVLLWRQ